MTPRRQSHEGTDKEWLERIEETLEKLKREEDSRIESRIKYEERRKALLEEKKLKQEEMLKKDQEKKDKKIKQNMLEKRWEMMRRVTRYIDENSEKWDEEKRKRETTKQQRLQEWARMYMFEKIKDIRERQKTGGNNLTIKLKPTVLQFPKPKQSPIHAHQDTPPNLNQPEQKCTGENQAEPCQADSQAEPCPAQKISNRSGQAEQYHILPGGADWTLPRQSL